MFKKQNPIWSSNFIKLATVSKRQAPPIHARPRLTRIGEACLSETVASLIKLLLQIGFCFFSNCVFKKLYNWIYLIVCSIFTSSRCRVARWQERSTAVRAARRSTAVLAAGTRRIKIRNTPANCCTGDTLLLKIIHLLDKLSIKKIRLTNFITKIWFVNILYLRTLASKINDTPKGAYLPILKLHSILVVANLLAHNNKSKICYCGQISLQSAVVNCSFFDNLMPMVVTHILLAMEHGHLLCVTSMFFPIHEDLDAVVVNVFFGL